MENLAGQLGLEGGLQGWARLAEQLMDTEDSGPLMNPDKGKAANRLTGTSPESIMTDRVAIVCLQRRKPHGASH